MRRTILTVASVAALAVPFLAFGSTAGASTPATPTCTTTSGTATFTPPLPTGSSKVLSTIAATGNETKCTGGGVTSAKVNGKIKFSKPGNCQTLLGGTGSALKGNLTFTWNTMKTSTASVTLAQQKGNPFNASFSGKITAGLFMGKTVSQTITFAPATGGGDCVSKPLSKVTFKQATNLVIK